MPAPDFDAARRERARRRTPLTFTLGGEDFTCLAAPLVGDALDLAAAPEWGEKGAVEALVGFIDALLATDDDRQRFQALLRRRDDPIDNEAIFDVGVYLAEQFSTGPFGPPTGSSSGPQPGGGKSKSTPVHKGRVTSST